MKKYPVLTVIAKAFKDSSDELTKELLDSYQSLIGKEEDITGGIRSQLTLRLIAKVKEKLNNEKMKDTIFKVQTFKKINENITGADLAAIISIKKGSQTLRKVFLGQSKVGTLNRNSEISAYNSSILKQASDMLKFSSDSFFLIYTEAGIKVFSALAVNFQGKNTIKSTELYFHDFGDFIEEFFKCFIGDHLIAGIYFDEDYLIDQYLKQQVDNSIEINIELKE
jgi:hypothetical protein